MSERWSASGIGLHQATLLRARLAGGFLLLCLVAMSAASLRADEASQVGTVSLANRAPAKVEPISAAELARAETDPEIAAGREALAAQNWKAALVHFDIAAQGGNVVAETLAGRMYETGPLMPPDRGHAAALYRRAALRGYDEAQYRLGHLYESNLVADLAAAISWYHLAAAQGHDMAIARMGVAYWSGEGVQQDEAAAVQLAQRGAAAGGPASQFLLGSLYLMGSGVPKNKEKAIELYRLSAEHDFYAAQQRLSGFYRNGIVVQQDAGLAAYWEDRAAHNIEGMQNSDFLIP
ncbi:tetratricopeptide repeat protein [Dongia soli]|uniref:Tetratricopeptide repeat protein n=1 Tax=Dongia soli TaxID=600628 RepID=A0ABU5EEQ9_9PROT|nr:tetratricopeptide repeat protein [Dongia soli]MDY0884693.1 tetratricopeptide repeat protein [Dongia soli]